MTCVRCNRPLTDPVSVERTMGPVCAAREQARCERIEELADVHYDLEPDPESASCERRDDGRHFSFRQVFVRHSPTGMEWGYGGSGPADFAINALLAFGLTVEKASNPRLYQAFKRRFVATLPERGGSIKRADFLEWSKGWDK